MHPSPRRRPRATAHEIYPVQSYPIEASQSPARHIAGPSRGPQTSPSLGRRNLFAPTQGIIHRAPGRNFRFHQFTNPLSIDTIHVVHVTKRVNYTSTTPQHTLKPIASCCSLGQPENEYVQEGRDKELPLECLHFPINHRFTKRFWRQSQYFFALADRQIDYLITFLLAISPLIVFIRNTILFIFFRWFFASHTDGCKQPNT